MRIILSSTAAAMLAITSAPANSQSFEAQLCISMAQDLCQNSPNYFGYGDFNQCANAIYQECVQAAVNDPDMTGSGFGRGFGGIPRCFVAGRIDSGTITNPQEQCS